MAVAYDNPIPGYKTTTVGNLRLWDAEPLNEFDLAAFNDGDYEKVNALVCAEACLFMMCYDSPV